MFVHALGSSSLPLIIVSIIVVKGSLKAHSLIMVPSS